MKIRVFTAIVAGTLVANVISPAMAVPPKQPNGTMPSIENKKSEPMGSAKDARGASGRSITLSMKAQNGSGESGTATLRQIGKNVMVMLDITGSGEKKQPAHIHTGTCSKLNPAPKYPLTLVEDGKSVTTIKDFSLADLTRSSMAINVHESTTNIKKYVACGNIKRAAMTGMK